MFALLQFDTVEDMHTVLSVHSTLGSAELERTRVINRIATNSREPCARARDRVLRLRDKEPLYIYTIQRTEYLARAGVRKRGRRRTTGRFDTREELEERVCRLNDINGLSYERIGKSCGVSATCVVNILKERKK